MEAPSLRDDGVAPHLRRYALFGHPLTGSRSPRIHALFGEQRGIGLHYELIEAQAADLADTLAQFEREGGLGANITTPVKSAVVPLCHELAPRAQRSGVVNVLQRLEGGGWRGDNTDGEGFINDLCRRKEQDIRARRTLLLGAGGAVAGILPLLLDGGVGEVVIAARRPERADALALRMGEPGRVHSVYWNDLAEHGLFDLVVNGTSAGKHGQAIDLPMRLLSPRAIAYDLNYGEFASGFLGWARGAGAIEAFDGLGMLVDQAAVSFALWHGVEPDADAVYDTLRAGA
ncbi:shikimate dehydrogenase [Pseudofulvimonas gallinarii]|jgi:shikimate dehydrogenase|uniref:Shikimate dehydrogenase (NADP(+)) n=1 Tax=Pseudofulvimonas gallinarii TaxID=634155 RepID=A0A4R3L6C9_9GAMM|nr:shikimate dehydrogenase [Pseudofulvimonas gallinarii]TCS93754.1 shikimate dehydrogenase [Pseudofulvimonas gallinarii]THD13274.1 shikimate dehydrogenase [Pseudofulvimonas gallinarii]